MNAPFRSLAVTGLAVAAACAAVAPASAAAKPKVKVAHFEATVKGSQHIQWEYHRPSAGPCAASEDGTGEALISYATASDGDTRMTAMQAGKDSPLFKLYKGRPALLPRAGRLDGGAILTMEGTHDVGGVDPSCPEQGGGGSETPIECGVTGGDHALELDVLQRNRLTVAGSSDGWSAARGGATPFLSTVFPNCPHWLGGPGGRDMLHVGEGHIEAIDAAFPEKRLFDRRRRRIVVRADVMTCYDEAGETACSATSRPFSGSVTTRWKLTLERVRG